MNSLKLSLIKFITFFSYSGFYAGLALLLAVGVGEDQSRIFSIPVRLLLCLLMATFIFINAFNKNKRIFYPEIMIVGFWLVYILKIIFVFYFTDERLNRHWSEYIFYTIAYCVLPYFTFRAVDFKRQGESILNAFIASGFVMSLLGTYIYGNLLISGVSRINNAQNMGFDVQTLSPHILSYTSTLTIGLALYQLMFRSLSATSKLYLWIVIGFSFTMFLLGASRGSVFALAFSSILFFKFGSPSLRIKFLIGVGALVPLIVVAAIQSGSSVFSSVTEIQSDIATQSESAVRLLIWYNSLIEFTENPIFGGSVQINGAYPHNFILEVLMVTGLVGFVLYIPIFYRGFSRGMKLVKSQPQYLWVMVIFVQGIFQHMFSGSINEAILLFIPLGLIYSGRF